VIDRDRLAVSVTYTLESSWGSRVVVKGAGFLLNDEMNDFNWLPGVTDDTGRIGTLPNLVAPGKRMLSSMSPTIVTRDGKPVLITGSPGGRTITNTVLCVLVNVIDFEMDLRSAIDAPRLHHGWLPDRVRLEPALGRDHSKTIERLKQMGHAFDAPAKQGDAHSIAVDSKTGEVIGVADQRINGGAAGH
jgi:gamma-glutamyltranspeptidase/glutathione hydrolase